MRLLEHKKTQKNTKQLKGDTAASFFGGIKNCTKIVNTE
jgi:hypothetical protein